MGKIGRSYPRLQPEPVTAAREPRARLALRFTIAGGVIALVGTVGWIGWLLAR